MPIVQDIKDAINSTEMIYVKRSSCIINCESLFFISFWQWLCLRSGVREFMASTTLSRNEREPVRMSGFGPKSDAKVNDIGHSHIPALYEWKSICIMSNRGFHNQH